MRAREDGYALSRGETEYLWEAAAYGEWFAFPDLTSVEVDRDTGIAYTRSRGLPLLSSELSPWQGMPRAWGGKRGR